MRGEDKAMGKTVLKWIFITLCGAGIIWFCLPVLHGGFAGGSVFGIFICGLGLALLLLYPRLSGRGRRFRLWARAAVIVYALGLAWAAFLTGLMISYQAALPPQGLNVVVLGAQVYGPEQLGTSLRGRVDRALAYLQANPDADCIVTGGQGGNEPCPEALAEKNALVSGGVDPARIYMEDKSRNTRQNLRFAMEIARREGLDTRVAVVTQNFHLFRAVKLAESAGFEAYGLPAPTDPILLPQYYGRELLSLTKWWAEELFLGGNRNP